MSLHPAVEKERCGGLCSQFPYNDDSQHCDIHRTPQQSFRRTRARACRRARAGQCNDAEGTIGFACRSRHRRMEGTYPLRLYCALMWWRPGRVRTQEETFPDSHNPSSQFMPYASASAHTACTPDADTESYFHRYEVQSCSPNRREVWLTEFNH